MGQDGRLSGNGAQQQVLEFGGHDGVKDGVLSMCHHIDYDDLTLFLGTIVFWVLAKRTLKLAHMGRNVPFNHDLGIGWNVYRTSDAGHHIQRLAMQCAGNFQFICIDWSDRLGREQGQRIHPNHDRDRKRLIEFFRCLLKCMQMPWQNQYGHAVF